MSTIEVPILERYPKNTQRVFHVETTWKRSFPRRFNMEFMWCVCRVMTHLKLMVSVTGGIYL